MAAKTVISPTLSCGKTRINFFSGFGKADFFISKYNKPEKSEPNASPPKIEPWLEKIYSCGGIEPALKNIPTTLYPTIKPNKKLKRRKIKTQPNKK